MVSITDTKHGIMFKTSQGVELLIHIGLDTVNLKGQHYTAHVTDGTAVKAGDLLVEGQGLQPRYAGGRHQH